MCRQVASRASRVLHDQRGAGDTQTRGGSGEEAGASRGEDEPCRSLHAVLPPLISREQL